VNQDLTPKQQTSEAIRQAETILIITGQHPNIDQASSTLALAAVLRKFGKKVTALISDSLPQQLSFLETGELDRNLTGQRDFILKVDTKKAQVDKLRYEVAEDKLNIYVTPFKGSFAPSDVTYDYGSYRYDLVIVLGVPTRARIDRIYADNPSLFDNLPIVNLDFHRSNEQYGAINLIEPTASSLCEILVALAESLQNGIVDEQIATAMLTGLMASTDRFTASHTTAKSLTVAAQLMAAGAKQPAIVRALFRDSRSDNRNDRPSQPSQPRPQAQPQVAQPAPAPIAEAAPEPEELHGPIPVEPAAQPIIDPGHVELMTPVETADFTAAAEILQQRQSD
jgi:nanoRNase/pAp phosphatase (c-di-AMP/oligoRNAs hydrolase)